MIIEVPSFRRRNARASCGRHANRRGKALERLESTRAARAESLTKCQQGVLDYGLETLRREMAWLEQLAHE